MVHDYFQVDVAQLSDIPPEEAFGGNLCLGATQNTQDTANVDGDFLELSDPLFDISQIENHGPLGFQDMCLLYSNCIPGDNSMEASPSTQTNLLRDPFP